jgi:hypothetical protein
MVVSRALMNTAAVKTTPTVVFSLMRARTLLPPSLESVNP